MAKGKKTGGRNFQPGQSGNPIGRPALSDEVRAIRLADSSTLIQLINSLLFSSLSALDMREADKSATIIERMLIAIVKKTLVTGDSKPLEFIAKLLGCYPGKSTSGMVFVHPESLEYIGPDGKLALHEALMNSIHRDL